MAKEDPRGARLATLLSFSSFFVFPAIPVWHTGAITIPFAIATLLAAAWLPRLRPAEWGPFVWTVAPAAISACWVLLAGIALAPEIVPRAVIALAMPFVIVVPARRLLRAGHGDRFILGAACAIVVHGALGAWQVVAFDRGEFPFAELMRTNPAMALLTDQIPTYVEWVKRPFGLFAEPSAMAACIGPWLVLVTTALFAPRPDRSRAHTAILALALGSGVALVVASKTGLAAPIVGGCSVAALASALPGRRSVGVRAAALAISAAIALASLLWLQENAGTRFQLAQNDSWQARLESLKLGVRWVAASFESGGRFLVGVGPGQSYSAINSTQLRYEAGAGVTAVWSVGVTYAMETGLLGIVAMVVLAAHAGRAIWASRARVAGATFALVWLSGIVVGTSYAGQPALWTALAALLGWSSVTARASSRRGPAWHRRSGPRAAGDRHCGMLAPSTFEAWTTDPNPPPVP